MRTIEIEDDVYEYLLRNSVRIAEDATSILRRLLHLPNPNGASNGVREDSPAEEHPSSTLQAFVTSSRFRARRNATDRFLSILSFAYQQDLDRFERVLEINGRRRTYFARTREEIERSGRSVYPRQIPDSPYWVMTNASTSTKKAILRSALKLVGYTSESTRVAVASLD